MATTVGEASIKLSFDSSALKSSMSKAEATVTAQAEKAGKSSGSGFANAWTVAAGNLISRGIEKVTSVIQNNLSDAIKRVDTMNNFPRVMSNLGISADAAADVIQDLSQKLIGLPTTLDSATSAVQRFTSKNGDVKKSEQIFLAVNDAILAGGASSEIQSAAMEQLSQAYAKGKPDMQEWRSIQSAMPAQLKQVSQQLLGNADSIEKYLVKARKYAQDNPLNSTAKELVEQLEAVKNGSGDMTTALGTALRSGVISMDEFTDTLIYMDETGVNGFASLSDQAKAATGGIETSMTNLNTAVTRAIANVINQIGSDRIQSVVNGIIEIIGNVGEAVGNVVNWIIDHHEIVISALVAIGGALAAAFVVEKVTSFVTALTTMTNPLTLITGGVGALVSVMLLYGDTVGASNENMSLAEKTIQASSQALAENKTKWEELQEAQQKQINAGMSEMQYYEDLYAELQAITDENGKVKDGYEERANFIAETLAEAFGIEIKYQDGVIQKYDEIKQKISEVIAQKKAQIILNAQEQLYTEALQKQNEVVKQATELKRQQQWAIDQYWMAYSDYLDAEQRGAQQEMDDAQAKMRALQEQADDFQFQYDRQQEIFEQYGTTIGQYEDNMAKFHEGKYNEMTEVLWEYDESYQNAADAEKAAMDEQNEFRNTRLQMAEDAYANTGNEIFNTMKTGAEAQNAESKRSLEAYENSIREALNKTVQDWDSNMDSISTTIKGRSVEFKRNGDGTVSAFIDGVESKKVASENEMGTLVDNTVAQITQRQDKARREAEGLTEYVAKEADNQRSAAEQAGGNLVQGLMFGWLGMKVSLMATAAQLAKGAIDTIKRTWGINSPSKVAAELGVYFSEGLGNGIEDEARNVIDKVEQLGQDVTATLVESTAEAAIDIPVASDGIIDGSVITQAFNADINGGFESADSANETEQPLIVDLNLDGQQIQRVFLQDIRRSTI